MSSQLYYLIILIIDIVVIIDIVKKVSDSGKKVLWIIAVLLLPLLGPILYWFIGRK